MKAFAFLAASILFATFPLVATTSFAQAPASGERPGRAHAALEKEMESLNRGMRKLGRQYADPSKKEDSLKLVEQMQKSAEAASKLTPSKAEKLAEPERAKFLATYRKDMEALAGQLADLKRVVEGGSADDVKAAMEKLNTLKRTSHKELGVDDDAKGPRGKQQREKPAATQ